LFPGEITCTTEKSALVLAFIGLTVSLSICQKQASFSRERSFKEPILHIQSSLHIPQNSTSEVLNCHFNLFSEEAHHVQGHHLR
uniref:Uncharacterized protein n=1 Tax=Kryptolebias marmoratus TaxID=37003 RepID=A0A3Q3AMA1_KRYMA